jgi:nucleoside-diphosphate-sugar epimerase
VSRVLVSGGARALGATLVRRLLADPEYEVRVADARPAPDWMREGCEVRAGDLRDPEAALAAARGCPVVVHVAVTPAAGPFELLAAAAARCAAVVAASVRTGAERLCLVSSAAVYEGARRFPTPEEDAGGPAPHDPRAFAEFAAERLCLAAAEQDGLAVTVCRPSDCYGPDDEPGASLAADLLLAALHGEPLRPGTGTRTPTFARDVADGVVAALSAPAAAGEAINLAAGEEVPAADLARRAAAAAEEAATPAAEPPAAGDAAPRRHPSATKAGRLLGWTAATGLREGLELTAARLRAQEGAITA